MSIEHLLFYAFAALTLVSSAGVIVFRNPVNSAMSLVSAFFFLAGIYVLLWAHTIAVLQVLVYAGAIMVLFLFVIMLLSLSDAQLGKDRFTLGRVLGGGAAGLLLAALGLAIWKGPNQMAVISAEQARSFGSLAKLGEVLYTQWLLPFEAVSLLLLVAIVGSVVVAKSRI